MGNIKQRIIQTDAFQYVTARIHQYNRRKELAAMCQEEIRKYRSHCVLQKNGAPSPYIWVCWWQGSDGMSPLVKECYDRILRFNPDKQVILITDENLEQYVTLPDYILEKYRNRIITKTHMSDILRAELLAKYGGVWMDITIYTFRTIPDCFYEKGLYTGRCSYNKKDFNVSRNRWTSYFWVASYPEHTLFCFLRDFWHTYWKDHDSLIEYFLIDYVLDLGYHSVPAIREALDAVDVNGVGLDFWVLLKNLRDDYDPSLLERISKSNWMQKLSYKGEEAIQRKALHPERTFYKTLFLDIDKGE